MAGRPASARQVSRCHSGLTEIGQRFDALDAPQLWPSAPLGRLAHWVGFAHARRHSLQRCVLLARPQPEGQIEPNRHRVLGVARQHDREGCHAPAGADPYGAPARRNRDPRGKAALYLLTVSLRQGHDLGPDRQFAVGIENVQGLDPWVRNRFISAGFGA
jgi:hypothetical protein